MCINLFPVLVMRQVNEPRLFQDHFSPSKYVPRLYQMRCICSHINCVSIFLSHKLCVSVFPLSRLPLDQGFSLSSHIFSLTSHHHLVKFKWQQEYILLHSFLLVVHSPVDEYIYFDYSLHTWIMCPSNPTGLQIKVTTHSHSWLYIYLLKVFEVNYLH